MAAADGRTERPVADLLFDPEEAGGWEFWQAVRLLEGMRDRQRPGARRAVRFSSHVGLAFPSTDIASITEPVDADGNPVEGATPRMSVHFMGLAGVMGPLPHPFTELVLERSSRANPALRDFLDLFNDRLLRLAYGVRKKNRIALSLSPPEGTEVARALFPLAGLGAPSLRRRMEPEGVPDAGILAHAGLLAQHPRSMAGLDGMLSSYFGVRIRGRQFEGRWLPVEPDQHTRIGLGGRNNRLGSDATLGTRFWDQSAAFQLHVGPLKLAQYRAFLPGGSAHRPLRELTRFYAGTELDFTARLVLDAGEVPSSTLKRGAEPRLGWTSWLGRTSLPAAKVIKMRGP
jgi:type VI secretion system protein ImpH